jgi:hypothetical protein
VILPGYSGLLNLFALQSCIFWKDFKGKGKVTRKPIYSGKKEGLENLGGLRNKGE